MKLGSRDPHSRTAERRAGELFGKFLVRQGVVPVRVLDQAAQAQVIYGSRLGATLVELGHLDEPTLERHLSGFLGVPLPPDEWLEPPQREALAALPAGVAARWRALPLRIAEQTLHVALLDPVDPETLAAVRFAASLPIVPYVLSERRLESLLETHMGIAFEKRLIEIDVEPPDAEVPVKPNAASALEAERLQREALGIAPLTAGDELIDSATFSELHERVNAGAPGLGTDMHSAAPMSPSSPTSLADLEADLASACDRQSAIEAALRIAQRHATAAALFAIGDVAITAVGVSTPQREDPGSGVFLPTGVPSVLSSTASTGQPYRGPVPSSGVDGLLFRALGRSEAREMVVLPIEIGKRVVNLLVADGGPDRLPATSTAALGALCELLGDAYARLIVEAKRLYR